MRNVIVGSFVGFVLGAAFLAACGSGSDTPIAPPRATSARAVTWTPVGATFAVANGIQMQGGTTWTGNAVYDNSADVTRDRFAAFEIAGNLDSSTSQSLTLDVGLLPTVDGSRYATEPAWIGRVEIRTGVSRRVTLPAGALPPLPLKFALRLSGSSAQTFRVSSFTLTPYDEELP